jgi:spore coat protein CotH
VLFKYRGDNWVDYVQTLDPKKEPSAAEKRRIMDFCLLISKASDAELAQRLGSFVDLEEFSRFMAVTVWLSDGDNIMDNGQNFYAYLDPKTQKFSFIPWDLDHTFGQFPQHLNQRQRETRPIFPPWYKPNSFLERVFKVPAFRELYLARLREFSRTLFEPGRLAAQVDELAPYLRPAVAEQGRVSRSDILDRFDKAIAGKSIDLREFGSGDIVPIKAFAVHRAKFVNDQLMQIHK